MLQIPHQHFLQNNISYLSFAQRYLPASTQVAYTSLSVPQQLMEQLNRQLNYEQFYFITDVRTGDIVHCNGVGRWLGYPDEHFTLQKYFSVIYPAHAIAESLYAAAYFEAIVGRQITPSFLHPSFITTLALKNKGGQYLYCKRRCYAIQFADVQQMTFYLNEFTIVKPLANEAFHTRLQQEYPNADTINALIKKKALQHFEEAGIFSTQELRILKRYSDNSNAGSQAVARAFKIKKATVDTHNKRIMKKAAAAFEQRFENAASAAHYIQLSGLI